MSTSNLGCSQACYLRLQELLLCSVSRSKIAIKIRVQRKMHDLNISKCRFTIIIFPVYVFKNFYFLACWLTFLFIVARFFYFIPLNHIDNQLRI